MRRLRLQFALLAALVGLLLVAGAFAAFDSAGSAGTASATITVTLSPVADAYTEQGAPGRNYGAATTLWSDGSPLSNAYLRFDASSVGTITSAKLRFYVGDGTSDGPLVYETDSAWSEATLDWATNPATRGAALANLGSVAAGGYVEVDVSSVLTSGRQVSFGLLPESSDGLGLDSREAAFPPQLVLSAASSGGSVAAPVNTAAPTISGSPVVGQTLTASSGSWSGSLTSYAYQWQRCDSSGAACAAIAGANASGYLVASADAGSTLRVAVTASNPGGSTTATSAPTASVTSGSSADPVAVAAGDICDSGGGCKQTAALIGQINPTRVLTLGDNAYPDGTLSNYTTYFDTYWGQYKSITSPAPGNHDYHVAGGADYFTYFNHPPQYYSFDLGGWHIVSLNGEIGITSGSTQETWFRNDLAAHTNKCTLVYWHEPRFSSGSVHGNNSSFQALWQDAYNGGVEIVLSGHDHQYERFAPMNASGALDTAEGVREFVVGTGGAPLYSFGTIQPNSEVRNSLTWGVLKLTLHSASFDWQFVPVSGMSFTDSGSQACH